MRNELVAEVVRYQTASLVRKIVADRDAEINHISYSLKNSGSVRLDIEWTDGMHLSVEPQGTSKQGYTA